MTASNDAREAPPLRSLLAILLSLATLQATAQSDVDTLDAGSASDLRDRAAVAVVDAQGRRVGRLVQGYGAPPLAVLTRIHGQLVALGLEIGSPSATLRFATGPLFYTSADCTGDAWFTGPLLGVLPAAVVADGQGGLRLHLADSLTLGEPRALSYRDARACHATDSTFPAFRTTSRPVDLRDYKLPLTLK